MKRIAGVVIVVSTMFTAFFALVSFFERDSGNMRAQFQSEALVQVRVPNELSQSAELGKDVFDTKCAACHGPNAVGRDGVGPPLVHIIYEPGHHSDESFQRAVAAGVPAHHWPFGNMPPVEGLSRNDVTTIVSYVRALQRENGIN